MGEVAPSPSLLSPQTPPPISDDLKRILFSFLIKDSRAFN